MLGLERIGNNVYFLTPVAKIFNLDAKKNGELYQTYGLSLSSSLSSTDVGLYNVRRDVDTVMGCCHFF
ncbi:protein of unknown function [Maridesulfovibrio hydrothermalis AM13 = DSM 14728]|uniref:Uncharacterized protein n=1 Tax=Maridesulfovibrio hydrothermalis AM13 = DSM 14728 TaxID=1121451 RepID=L0RBI0_9BACT|nr:protein of unknown function [Maridesulfovibrio hydrothermalis AM13 = DSM 14728]